jgi:hypothetical protein
MRHITANGHPTREEIEDKAVCGGFRTCMSKGATNARNKRGVQGQKYAATQGASRKYEGSRIGNAVHRNNYAAHPLSKVGIVGQQ